MQLRSVLNEISFRLTHYARTAARPGGIRHLAKLAAVVLLQPFRLEENADPFLIPRMQIRSLVYKLMTEGRHPIEIVCVGDIAGDVALPKNVTHRFDIDPSRGGKLDDFNLLPEARPLRESSILIVYATAGFLSTWKRVEEDLDRFFTIGYEEVIVVLTTERFRHLDFAGHSYLLSILLTDFPRGKFLTKLEVYLSPRLRHQRERPIFRAIRALAERVRQTVKRACIWIWGETESSPTHFSALILSIRAASR
jgi:hypothetical protein